MDFPFHQVYALDDYNSISKPAVFFGMYRYEDYCVWLHHGQDVIFWTGQDVLQWGPLHPVIDGPRNVTAHTKVYKWLKDQLYNCELVKPAAFLNIQQPQRLGPLIYAYCPDSAPDYHGIKFLRQLVEAGYDILIGDGYYSQTDWRGGKANELYNQCFIGLCLSEFAGGGTSIIEMGLRGMRVVTNVFDLPNCIPWNSVEDVMQAIELESKNIGTKNETLTQQVWDSLDHTHEWLEI